MRKAITLAACSAALLGTVACGCTKNGAASTTSTTAASTMSTEDAVNHLTGRRCDREIDCNNVGAGKRYEDRGGCERKVAQDLRGELGPTVCSYGIREDRLGECMQALRTETCANPIDTMSRIAPCRTDQLCVR